MVSPWSSGADANIIEGLCILTLQSDKGGAVHTLARDVPIKQMTVFTSINMSFIFIWGMQGGVWLQI